MTADSANDRARQRIDLWRMTRGLTQAVLGHAAGHNQSWYASWQAGLLNAGVDELDAMARALGQSLSDVFDHRADRTEDDVMQRFRALSRADRRVVVALLRRLTPGTRGRRRDASRG